MVGMPSNMIGTWPPMTAVRASFEPRKATPTMSTPAIAFSISPAMW